MNDLLRPQQGDIPRVHPDELSAPFWEGCRAGRLLFQRCQSCGEPTFGPALQCRVCGGTVLYWEESVGIGSLYSVSTVFRPQEPAFEVPYAAAIVALDEGFHMVSNIVNCRLEEVHIGMRVKVLFVDVDDGLVLPYFEPLQIAETRPETSGGVGL
jgi:uncharacterized OB-fold protein